MKDIFAVIGALFLVFLMVIAYIWISGWVLSTLWSWFIVPIFGLPLLTIPYALGIMLIITFLTKHDFDRIKEEYKNKDVRSAFGRLFSPVFVLLLGWIIKLFI